MEWTEETYVAHLRGERRRFAWVMRRYGGLTPAKAEAAALDHYPYQEAGEPHRGLVLHDEAWHRAMLTIHRDLDEPYWKARPELTEPPAAYRALD